MTAPQKNVPTEGVVQKIEKTQRQFSKGGIMLRQYLVTFDNNYTVEYCLPALQEPEFKEGDTILYKVVFRGDKGDEIEFIQVNRHPGGGLPKPLPSSMIGHPAVIALTLAKDYTLANGDSLEEMQTHADALLGWLLDRRDLESFQFGRHQ